MGTIYHASFYLGKDQQEPDFDAVIETVKRWAYPKSFADSTLDDFSSSISIDEEKFSVKTKRNEENEKSSFALRFRNPDHITSGMFWQTDLFLHHQEEQTKISIELSIARDGLGDLPRRVSRPRLVLDLIQTFGAYRDYIFDAEPKMVTDDNIEGFVDKIFDDHRELPLVYITPYNSTLKPLVNPKGVSYQCTGVGHVFVADEPKLSWRLDELAGKGEGCYNGAIRIYSPYSTALDQVCIPKNIKMTKRMDIYLLEKLAEQSLERDDPLGENDLFRDLIGV